MGSTKLSNILILGAIEAEKPQKTKWVKYCETPCMTEFILNSCHKLLKMTPLAAIGAGLVNLIYSFQTQNQ